MCIKLNRFFKNSNDLMTVHFSFQLNNLDFLKTELDSQFCTRHLNIFFFGKVVVGFSKWVINLLIFLYKFLN